MIHSEREAIRLQCCNNLKMKCIASSCMAWRWAEKAFSHEETEREIVKEGYPSGDGGISKTPTGEGPHDTVMVEQIKTYCWVNHNRKGYCGLAGRP